MNGVTIQGDATADKWLFKQRWAEAVTEVDRRLQEYKPLIEVTSNYYAEITAAPVTAALEIASTVKSNMETAIDNYFEISKSVMLMPNTAALSQESGMTANSWRTQQERIFDNLKLLYSPSEYLGHIIELAFEMVEAGKASYRDTTLNVFSAAEKHVRALTLAAVRTTQERQEAGRALHSLFDSFSPDQYLSNIAKLAHQMWDDAGDQSAMTAFSIWLAAERHIRVIGSAAIGAATSGTEAGKALAAALKRFVPETHLSAIRVAAYCLSLSADSSASALDNWLRAENQMLARIRTGSAV